MCFLHYFFPAAPFLECTPLSNSVYNSKGKFTCGEFTVDFISRFVWVKSSAVYSTRIVMHGNWLAGRFWNLLHFNFCCIFSLRVSHLLSYEDKATVNLQQNPHTDFGANLRQKHFSAICEFNSDVGLIA